MLESKTSQSLMKNSTIDILTYLWFVMHDIVLFVKYWLELFILFFNEVFPLKERGWEKENNPLVHREREDGF